MNEQLLTLANELRKFVDEAKKSEGFSQFKFVLEDVITEGLGNFSNMTDITDFYNTIKKMRERVKTIVLSMEPLCIDEPSKQALNLTREFLKLLEKFLNADRFRSLFGGKTEKFTPNLPWIALIYESLSDIVEEEGD